VIENFLAAARRAGLCMATHVKSDQIFGDKNDFAIEAGVEPDLVPPSLLWGHMRIWCAGVPLGNINDRQG
jgi:hypothetical protein